jgi:transposase
VPLVFDHFHVVKLMNECLTEVRRTLFHELTQLMDKKVLKGIRWLLLKNPENLNKEKDEPERLQEALRLNEPLMTAYYLKEDLRQFWSQPNKETAAQAIQSWVDRALSSGIGPLMKTAKTIAGYRFGILAWYDHPISSGPMEGTNNKIKVMKRQAYGFRDQEFFKLRILAIHTAKYALTQV